MNYRFTVQVPMIPALVEAFGARFPGAVYQGSERSTFTLEGSAQPNPADLRDYGAFVLAVETFQGWTELGLEETSNLLATQEPAPVGAYSAPLPGNTPSGPRGRLSNEVRDTILAMATVGKSAEEIAQETGRKIATIEAVIASAFSVTEEGASEASPAQEDLQGPVAPPAEEEAVQPPAKASKNGRKVSA